MQPVTNLEEQPGKTVGRRAAKGTLSVSGAQTIAESKAWQKAMGGLRVRRGVYCFRTHEEADAWLWARMTRASR